MISMKLFKNNYFNLANLFSNTARRLAQYRPSEVRYVPSGLILAYHFGQNSDHSTSKKVSAQTTVENRLDNINT